MGTQSNDTADQTATAVEVAPDMTPRRNALMHAFAEAEQLVSQLHAVPTDVDVHSDPLGVYRVRLYFSRDRQGVMEFATLVDAEVGKDPSYSGLGEYIEARARYQGVDVVAWAIDGGDVLEDAHASDVDEAPIAYALADQAATA
ncbi:hypothetical protein [Streptomyces sp. NPDC102487]|uniref:hypothetical protein n=1 Tax=Streptomyces sp. NPDC102487 TaxID=3366182 RepID=UPI00381DC194